MDTITLLQVGDVHFDQAVGAELDVDAKDRGLPPHVVDAIGALPLQCVMKTMTALFDHVDAVLFCGDLTTYGDLTVYCESVDYLELNFDLRGGGRWPEDAVHAVPGNHDVDRKLVNPGDDDLLAKFVPLDEAWAARSVPVMDCSNVRASEVVSGGAHARLFSLNSCIGCGEYRQQGLSEDLREEFEARAAAGDEDAAAALFEQLDAPMFRDDDVADVTAQVRGLDITTVPILLAHHNLLPQRQPRLQIYAEMVNSGAVRTRLAACSRPVLYLHGHIHDDPIEVVEQLFPHCGKIVSISAPLLSEGFNVIAVSFGQRGLPLGTTITRWRYKAGGDVVAEPPIRVPLRRSTDESHEATIDVLRILDAAQVCRWRAFLDMFRERHGNAHSEAELEDAVREAHWAGHLHIDGAHDPPKRWVLRRSLP